MAVEKITTSSYHMEEKTYVKASCMYNINTEEYFFAAATFEGL